MLVYFCLLEFNSSNGNLKKKLVEWTCEFFTIKTLSAYLQQKKKNETRSYAGGRALVDIRYNNKLLLYYRLTRRALLA
jgi:hypothetical protein